MTIFNLDEILKKARETDFWKAQALLYQKELAKVNRACSRKAWHIKVLRNEIEWLNRDKALFIGRRNQQGQEKGREK